MDITPEFISRVFSKSKIDPKYMDVLTNPEALSIYRVAFTSNTVDPDSNYELYEYMGDVAAKVYQHPQPAQDRSRVAGVVQQDRGGPRVLASHQIQRDGGRRKTHAEEEPGGFDGGRV